MHRLCTFSLLLKLKQNKYCMIEIKIHFIWSDPKYPCYIAPEKVRNTLTLLFSGIRGEWYKILQIQKNIAKSQKIQTDYTFHEGSWLDGVKTRSMAWLIAKGCAWIESSGGHYKWRCEATYKVWLRVSLMRSEEEVDFNEVTFAAAM